MLTNSPYQGPGFNTLTLFQLGHGEHGSLSSLADETADFETLEICVDSGASVSALPLDKCEDYPDVPTEASRSGRFYWSADGNKVYDKGAVVPQCISEEGDVYEMQSSTTTWSSLRDDPKE